MVGRPKKGFSSTCSAESSEKKELQKSKSNKNSRKSKIEQNGLNNNHAENSINGNDQKPGTEKRECSVECITDKFKDLFNFKPRTSTPTYPAQHRPSLYSGNFMHYLYGRSIGLNQNATQKKRANQPLHDLVSSLSLFRVASPFDRRVMVLAWHPYDQNILVAGSKNGDMIYMNVNDVDNIHTIEGIGPGGQLNALKFWPTDVKKVLTAAVDGTVTLYDFEGGAKQIFLDTRAPVSDWYCSADISLSNRVFVAGDNRGNVNLLSMEGKVIWTQKLHKNKVHHIEFNERNPWMMVTAGVDKTVKIWDIRKIDSNKDYLVSLDHERGVNSAYFSLTDGTRLLTTDQNSHIHVYRGPTWHLETEIIHPHRFFQHLTPIKAQWHPLADIVTIGRYPDAKCPVSSGQEARTIDVFCAETGKLLTQIYDASAPGIVSLNTYNKTGDMLASGMGQNILVWRRDQELKEKQDQLLRSIENHLDPDDNVPRKGSKRKDSEDPRKNVKKMKTSRNTTDDLKKKVVVKTKTKTKDKDDKKK